MKNNIEIYSAGKFKCLGCEEVFDRTPNTRSRRHYCQGCLSKMKSFSAKIQSKGAKKEKQADLGDLNNMSGTEILRIIKRIRQEMETDPKLRMQIEKLCES